MNKEIDNLKERYQSFIGEKEARNFFFGLADYVKYIENTPNFYSIIKPEIKEKEELLKERDECEEKALQELMQSKKALLEIIRKNKISNPELDKDIEELGLFEKGDIRISGVRSDNIERYLWNIGKISYGLGYKKELKRFIDKKPKTQNIYIDNKNLVFSNLLDKRHELDKNIAYLQGKKLWGCWDYLKYVPLFWVDGKGFEIVPENDLGAIDICFNLVELLRATENDASNRVIIYIDKEKMIADYRLYTNRIHLYLLEKGSASNKSEKKYSNDKIEKITIIELKNGRHLLAVNDDYKGVKKIRKSKYYPIFIEEVSKRDVLNRTDNKKVSDEMAEYFNNNKKCIIYMNGKYPLKTIFTGNEAEREISWEVKTEIIDEDTYSRQMKKVNKK